MAKPKQRTVTVDFHDGRRSVRARVLRQHSDDVLELELPGGKVLGGVQHARLNPDQPASWRNDGETFQRRPTPSVEGQAKVKAFQRANEKAWAEKMRRLPGVARPGRSRRKAAGGKAGT